MYQNTTPDNPNSGWNGDQGHHFAAFFELGFNLGSAALGNIASAVYEWVQATGQDLTGQGTGLNMGDIQLGIAAATMGADLAAGKISASSVGSLINSTLCQH